MMACWERPVDAAERRQGSRLKPRLGPAAEAANARPFTGRCRAASSLAHFERRSANRMSRGRVRREQPPGSRRQGGSDGRRDEH